MSFLVTSLSNLTYKSFSIVSAAAHQQDDGVGIEEVEEVLDESGDDADFLPALSFGRDAIVE